MTPTQQPWICYGPLQCPYTSLGAVGEHSLLDGWQTSSAGMYTLLGVCGYTLLGVWGCCSGIMAWRPIHHCCLKIYTMCIINTLQCFGFHVSGRRRCCYAMCSALWRPSCSASASWPCHLRCWSSPGSSLALVVVSPKQNDWCFTTIKWDTYLNISVEEWREVLEQSSKMNDSWDIECPVTPILNSAY